MADGKWIHGLRPDLSLREAAALALTARLDGVRRALAEMVHDGANAVEPVHQLRVSTRRAGAALKIFRDCLPKKRYRAAADLLRDIRRAAGAARDWDVFQETLSRSEELRAAVSGPALHFLLGCSAARRMDAQVTLDVEADRWNADLDRRSDDVLEALHEPQQLPAALGDRAVADLALLTRELSDASDPIPEDYGELHQVRILGKRLRYAMELFAECFTPVFRERIYPAVEEMQEILGAANDSHVAGDRLAAVLTYLKGRDHDGADPYQRGIEALARVHAGRLVAGRDRFATWLPHWKELLAALPLETLRLREPPNPQGA